MAQQLQVRFNARLRSFASLIGRISTNTLIGPRIISGWKPNDFVTLNVIAQQMSAQINIDFDFTKSIAAIFDAYNKCGNFCDSNNNQYANENQSEQYICERDDMKNDINNVVDCVKIALKYIKIQQHIINAMVPFLSPDDLMEYDLVQNALRMTYFKIQQLFETIYTNIGSMLLNQYTQLSKHIVILCIMLEILEDIALIRACANKLDLLTVPIISTHLNDD